MNSGKGVSLLAWRIQESIRDTWRAISVLHVVDKVPRDKLTDRKKELLDVIMSTGRIDTEKKKILIKRDLGSIA